MTEKKTVVTKTGKTISVPVETEKNIDFAEIAIPDDARIPKGSLTMAYWSVCSAMFWLVVSASMALAFGTINTLIGLVLAALTFGLCGAVIARYSIKTGLSVALFSRVVFGRLGATLATLIFFATAIYYAVFEGSVIAVAIQTYFSMSSLNLVYFIVVLYSIPLVFGSVQNWLDRFNGVLLPFYIIGLFGAVIWAISLYGYSNDWLTMVPDGGAPGNGWWKVFTYYLGTAILMMFTWDYARMGKKEDANYHAKFNFGIPFYAFSFVINGIVGIFIATTIPTEGGLTEVSAVLAILKLMGFWGLLFVWISQTRINTANFYLAAVNMQAFFHTFAKFNLPKFAWVIFVGIAVYLIMLTNVFSFILTALAYQSIFVVAWVAIAMTHIFSAKYEQLFGDKIEYSNDKVPTFNHCGLLSWFIGAGFGVILLNTKPPMADFAAPITAVVAAVCYYVMLTKAQKDWFVKIDGHKNVSLGINPETS